MYEYIKGIYKGFKKDYIIIENQGIGYKIFTSGSTMAALPDLDQEVFVYLKQVVREDFIGLYGFITEEELELFNNLTNINGVGAKAALSILSIGNVTNIKYAIVSGDEKFIIKAQGIGKKIAQRIILELKDKLYKEQISEGITVDDISIVDNIDNNKIAEVREALLALGYGEKEIEKALKKATLTETIENIIKEALKLLMN
ncbi:Holliday junction branch migration protein RuvA [Clostridium bornimense]|uniref:Holliday junction branch migration protein RuvA n=1 Tax=Clostridium bornimense TaxID=1216932 RepID=UPI001C10B172|nr:Holliday junction branch migration protein RuvA [Clostridium bornimense]MBU5315128.1 Holliday junction branch migration protein RuvA [Clostridium bornimense]